MVSYDVLSPGGRVTLHAQTPFVQSDVKRPLVSVGKLTQSGAEVKFGSEGSWSDLHTDTGLQRVLVRAKGKTLASRSRKLMLGSSLRQVAQLHMQWWRQLTRDRQSRKTHSASGSTGSCDGTETRRDSGLAA